MKPSILLSLLMLISSCGIKVTSSGYQMGKTTRAEVIAKDGPPESEVDIPVPDSKIMNYSDGSKIQLKGDIVTNRFSNPTDEQKLVMWWKHRFKDCATIQKTLPQNSKSHTPPEIEYMCPTEGISIIYTEGSETVGRVVEFEK